MDGWTRILPGVSKAVLRAFGAIRAEGARLGRPEVNMTVLLMSKAPDGDRFAEQTYEGCTCAGCLAAAAHHLEEAAAPLRHHAEAAAAAPAARAVH
jgi:hypothetical protein